MPQTKHEHSRAKSGLRRNRIAKPNRKRGRVQFSTRKPLFGIQPKNPSSSYTAVYDAWNRLVALKDGANFVNKMEYDGLNRRVIKKKYTSGSLDETRHYYYSRKWQVLEERVDSSSNADRQLVWGARYIDDLILRDRDTSDPKNGTLDERLYSLQDALFNVTALINTTGTVVERFAYTPYGKSEVLTPTFAPRAETLYNWKTRFTGRRVDLETGLQLNRNRYYHNGIGRWANRDPIGYAGGDMNLYGYVSGWLLVALDPSGLRNYICILSNVNGDDGLTSGHANILILEGTNTTTLGNWPDNHPQTTNNGSGSDIRINFPGDDPSHYQYRHCVEATDEEIAKLRKCADRNWEWAMTNNCSSFASECFYEATGIDIDADDFLGIETPRELGDNIIIANGGRDSNIDLNGNVEVAHT